MTIALNDPITREDIIDRFHLRVRDYVTSQTDWINSTVIISGRFDLDSVTRNSTSGGTTVGGGSPGTISGGTVNRITYSTKTPAAIPTTEFSSEIGASSITVGHVMEVLKSFMNLYANNHMVNLRNTGNLTTGGSKTSFNLVTHTGVARFNGSPSATLTSITNDLANSATNRGIQTGALITATNLNNLIEDCRSIWQSRCNSGAIEEFRYSYCHSSCHGSHGSHGSRGRR